MLRKEHSVLLATLKRERKRKRGAFCANGGVGGLKKDGERAVRETKKKGKNGSL